MSTWHHRDRRIRQGLGCWKLVRYADDFVVCVKGEQRHAERLRDEVAEVLAPLGLHLEPNKTRVVRIDEGFDFLGFHIRRMQKRGTRDRYFVYTMPSRKARAAIRERIRWHTRRSTLHDDLDQLLRRVNRSLQGWANYFRHGVSKAVFSQVDYLAWRRIGTWIRRKHGRISWREVRRRYCDTGWRFAHNGVVFRGAASVAVTRYRYQVFGRGGILLRRNFGQPPGEPAGPFWFWAEGTPLGGYDEHYSDRADLYTAYDTEVDNIDADEWGIYRNGTAVALVTGQPSFSRWMSTGIESTTTDLAALGESNALSWIDTNAVAHGGWQRVVSSRVVYGGPW